MNQEIFNELYKKSFNTSIEAINECQKITKELGFGIRIRTSKSFWL